MEQPKKFNSTRTAARSFCRLDKPSYGTNQYEEIWGYLLDTSLKSHRALSSNYIHRIHFYKKNNEFVIIAIVVDDSAFASDSPKLLDHLKNHLAANFDVKLFGALKSFIGWNIIRGVDGITINQTGYARSILSDNDMKKCNGVNNPLPKNAYLLPAHENEKV